MAIRISVIPGAMCRVGQRYTVTVSCGGGAIYVSDGVGRSQTIRAAVAGARWYRRAVNEFRRGGDIR